MANLFENGNFSRPVVSVIIVIAAITIIVVIIVSRSVVIAKNNNNYLKIVGEKLLNVDLPVIPIR